MTDFNPLSPPAADWLRLRELQLLEATKREKYMLAKIERLEFTLDAVIDDFTSCKSWDHHAEAVSKWSNIGED